MVRFGELRELLRNVYDLERLAGRVAFGNAGGRDLAQLRDLPYCANKPTAYGCAGAKPLAKELREQLERVISSSL